MEMKALVYSNKYLFACLFACATLYSEESAAKASPLQVVSDGRSSYRIVISQTASDNERHAAEELRAFLKQISSANIPIVTDDQPLASSPPPCSK